MRLLANEDEYTVDDLLGMTDATFRRVVSDNMYETLRGQSAFQHEDVIQRTLLALIDSLWATNAKLDERADDPTCPVELYQKTLKYRALLLSVIEQTERRLAWMQGTKEKTLRKWRQVLHEVIDGILSGKHDDEILAIKIPAFDGADREDMYDLETWFDIRCAKDPSRVHGLEEAA